MNIIGINPGHNASIAVAMNGEIIFAINEERLNRTKNYLGIPLESLEYCYEHIIKKDEVDYFGLHHTTFEEFILFYDATIPYDSTRMLRKGFKRFFLHETARKAYFSRKLGVPFRKIVFINHHKCHAYSASFLLDDRDWLIFTADGEGDLECATVYKKVDEQIVKLTGIHRMHSLGYFFYFVTKYLGMRPNEDEYKVMGLEPYAKKDTEEFKKTYEEFMTLFYFEDLDFRSRLSTISKKFYLDWLSNKIRFKRFDYIAAAAQKTVESVVIQWIKNWISTTGIKNVALSGGLFMNVKLNQRIYNLKEVGSIFIVPSSGDETTPLGICNIISVEKDNKQLKPLSHLYLGNSYSDKDIEAFIETKLDTNKYAIRKYGDELESVVADLLAKGIIVARFDGRMEFGTRALGNRSILAHPNFFSVVKTINNLIKSRDFWMPFAPSILEEDCDLYLINPKKMYAPYMTITFDTTQLGRENLSAAAHPYDQTIRVEMVKKEKNYSYHRLISEFKKLTGIAGVLNTSFNLHGEPIVCFLEDALHTFDNSGLTHLSLGRFLIVKNSL